MKRKTYNNVLRATKILMKKGYDKTEASQIALIFLRNMKMM